MWSKKLCRKFTFSSEMTGSCDKYLELVNVFNLYAEILTSTYDEEHNNCDSKTDITIAIRTQKEISQQTDTDCSCAIPLLIHVIF